MTKKQKFVVLTTCFVLILMLLYQPFSITTYKIGMNSGYHFIVDPPGNSSLINIGLLAIQYLFVVTIGVGLLFVLKPKDKGGKSGRDD